MADKLDEAGATEFAVRCAGYTGDLKDLDHENEDRLILKGAPKAIASLAMICAHQHGAEFSEMIGEAKALFDQEFDAEYSWVWRLMLESGGMSLEKRGDRIEVFCMDDDERDQLVGDLKDHRIRHKVEPDPEHPESHYVLIERGFLVRSERTT